MQNNNTSSLSDAFLLENYAGYFVVKNMAGEYVKASKYTANLFGYKKTDQLLGKRIYEVNCHIADYAENFISQDQLIVKNNRDINTIDIHPYKKDTPEIFLMKKSLIKCPDTNKNAYISCFCWKISSEDFTELAIQINKTNPTKTNKRRQLSGSYYLDGVYGNYGLTMRESQCLFFLLRGHSAKQIADIICKSPRTVEYHQNNIKAKMNCKKKSELIDLSISLGFFDIIPKGVVDNYKIKGIKCLCNEI